MASTYDIATEDGKEYYRMNKEVINKSDIPAEILAKLTPNNVVDENGMEIVEQKVPEASKLTDDNRKDLGLTDAPQAGGESTEATPPAAPEGDQNNQEEKPNETSTPETPAAPAAPAAPETPAPAAPANPPAQPETPAPAPAAPEQPAPAPAPAPQPAQQVAPFRSSVPQSKPGMGFPRVNGKTVDIFDGKTPHTHVKNVGGVVVPLSEDSYKTKSDNQICQRLAELGKETIDFEAIAAQRTTPASTAGNGPNSNPVGGGEMMLSDEESDDNPSSQDDDE